MTPWAQARFDAEVPTLGPRVIAAKENDPILDVIPTVCPNSSVFPSHSRSFRFVAEFSCSSNTIAIGARSGWAVESFPKILIRPGWDTPLAVGGQCTRRRF